MKNAWPIKKLADLAVTISTGPFGSMLHKSDYVVDGIPLVNPMNIVDSRIVPSKRMMVSKETRHRLSNYALKNGDVVVARRGELGRCATITERENGWLCGTGSCFIRLSKELDQRFFVMFFGSSDVKKILDDSSVGTTMSNLNHGILKNLRIPVPPINEQQRIVAILDKAFDAIATAKANTEKNLENASNLVAPIFSAVMGSFEHTKWNESTVADVAVSRKGSIRTGPFGSQLLHSEFADRGIAVLGIDNAVRNEFTWSERRYITEEKFAELRRYQVFPGDVLITIMGTCGRCAIVPNNIPVAINSKHLCCITLDKQKCLPGYLHAYFLYHPVAREFLSARATGSIMEGLNMGIIKELPLILPPLGEQTEILRRVKQACESSKQLEQIYQRKLTALDALKKSLLHHAFTGQLTVDQPALEAATA